MFEDLILFSLVVFAISSIWLFSPGPEPFRNWWIENTGFLAPLGYCQLCCSWWIALFTYGILYDEFTLTSAIIYALVASVVSWAFGAFVNAALWIRGICEVSMRNE
jgi:hypothetical protein